MQDFLSRINGFVTETLGHYSPNVQGEKVIHDPIWGSVVYQNWEIALIDSPLLQRLRDIRQVGLAELTYPAARHTRFEHSLGTVAIASRMIEKITERCASAFPSLRLGEAQRNLVRLAALLHDVGHCPYSHLSENVYSSMPAFRRVRAWLTEQYAEQGVSPKPHEIFSYLILTSDAFASFFHREIPYPQKGKTLASTKQLLLSAARMVIGADNLTTENGEPIRLSYLTSLINGEFDADKLDYTQRDSYTAGIALTYGVERFLLKLRIVKKDDAYVLAMTSDALTAVEELIFNRCMLYNYMYRHQKVLATEELIRDLLYALVQAGKICHPCDFLMLQDRTLNRMFEEEITFSAYAPKRTVASLGSEFGKRNLPKRCLELNCSLFRSSQENADELLDRLRETEDRESQKELLSAYTEGRNGIPASLRTFLKRMKQFSYDEYVAFRLTFYNVLCDVYAENGKAADFDPFDVHLIFPDILSADINLEIVAKNEWDNIEAPLAYMKEWVQAFNCSKWHGYVFVSSRVDRTLARTAAVRFLHRQLPDLMFSDV